MSYPTRDYARAERARASQATIALDHVRRAADAPRRLSGVDKDRLDWAIARVRAASQLLALAKAAGSQRTLAAADLESMLKDLDAAKDGKRVTAFDALGGRGEWAERKEARRG